MVDATTQAALEAPVLYWRVLLYADFVDDIIRTTSGLYDKTISGSGDAELDGTYDAIDPNLISVNSVTHNETGSDSVSISLNGLLTGADLLFDRFDKVIQDRQDEYIRVRGSNFLNTIGDTSRWQGRVARLWFYCVDDDENQIGQIIPYYTGYMNDISITGSPSQQIITLTIENYVNTLSGSQNKNYLSQNIYDSGDLSGEAAIAAVNGTTGAGLAETSVVNNPYYGMAQYGGWRGY